LELKRLDPKEPRPAFTCGNDDLDDFYRTDSVTYASQLLSVTYALFEEGEVAAFFSVSNDSIRSEDTPRGAFKRAGKEVPREKRHSSMPATKIGRLGVSKERRENGLGSFVLNYLKYWFVSGNKTGCRFLLVDAYNEADVIGFYQKNGFQFLTGLDEKEGTRIMYFDLMPIANKQLEQKQLRSK